LTEAADVPQVAAALVRAWPTLDQDRLISHAGRLGNTSVHRRLGALIQALDLDETDRLVGRLPHRRWRGRPVSLDPSLPAGGEIDRRWRVRMNVPPDELSVVGRT